MKWKQNGRPSDHHNPYSLEWFVCIPIHLITIQNRKCTPLNPRMSENRGCKTNKLKTFYSLLKNQSRKHVLLKNWLSKKSCQSKENIMTGWYKHLRDLALISSNTTFDTEYFEKICWRGMLILSRFAWISIITRTFQLKK